VCLRQPLYDYDHTDANLRPIYCSEDSRIKWSSVSSNACCGTNVLKMKSRRVDTDTEVNCMRVACFCYCDVNLSTLLEIWWKLGDALGCMIAKANRYICVSHRPIHYMSRCCTFFPFTWPRVGPGHPSSPLVHLFPLLLFPFFHWLYLFSSFVHPFPFYQNSPIPFQGRRS